MFFYNLQVLFKKQCTAHIAVCNYIYSESVSTCIMSISYLQGSVKTLFTWDGKLLHHFAANLFAKRWTTFYQNHPSFV